MHRVSWYKRDLVIGILLGIIGGFCSFSISAAEPLENLDGELLHTQLVKTAITYDYFNQRCRGVRASTNASAVNRLLIQKYRLTLNNFIKQYIASDAEKVQIQLKNDLYRQIADLDGCQSARDKGLESSIKSDYRQLFEKVEDSSWFPVMD
ncbi:MAG: hypothetical protein CO158_04080 [Piscirickettsiaceae bacterium CG_4_9_14_3_um_filter_43_564]|nr:hypothetical protein [Thiomicrospira sp.]OIP96620.1 MAG: hypothetical protein AUK56_01525 [Thiomicrospira sp. CG2_30_44_34]PIQ06487.1 MAG: hypothetical protein COW74_00260 [Piscirickettsiaceae bacterium CG18_big_fil_WC_8_21_14_2_50_44_103]PIU39180.1 MAG: hypothetical protein COT01_02760 [Piscirickettsiaceae bacterium CG07_land_8_20_14_0_80_44_28]PIW78055.1 MAG: hypothetical protein CO000_03755 [Piscirickettsiaceae bacterium CG_4_8_14_3_um_filter_44_38]PIX78707.1 MAG: hypothetical protein CO